MKDRKNSRNQAASLTDLGRLLVERVGPQVQATDLIEIRAELTDSLVVSLLAELSEKCGATTLGELISHPRASSVAPRPGGVLWARFEQGLLAWADEARQRAPGARGTAPAAGVPGPPQKLEEMELWAREYGVDDCLDHPAGRLTSWLDSANDRYQVRAAPGATVRRCLSDDRLGGGVRAISQTSTSLARAARAYLWYRAGRKRVEEARKRLWSRKLTDPVLRTFSRQLQRRLKRVLQNPGADVPVVFDEAPLALQDDPPTLSVHFSSRGSQAGQLIVTGLSLEGVDQGTLRLKCSCQEGLEGACPHSRVLLEWTLDALHDANDALHAELSRVAAVPSWARLVESLQEGLRGPASTEEEDRELAWRIGGQGRDVELRPVVRTRLKSGRWGRGRLVTQQWLLDEEQLLEPRDREALSALILAEEQEGSTGRARFLAHALEALVGHPAVFSQEKPTQRVKLRSRTPIVVLQIDHDEGALALRLGSGVIPIDDVAGHALGDRHLVRFDEAFSECIISPLGARASSLVSTLTRHGATLPPESHLPLLEVLSQAQPDIEIEVPDGLCVEAHLASSDLVLRLDPLRGGGLLASLLVHPLGSGAAWPPGEGPIRVLGQSEGQLVSVSRDHGAEKQRAMPLVEKLGLSELPFESRPFSWRLEEQDVALDLLVAAREFGDELPLEWPEGGSAAWRVATSSIGDLRVRVGRLKDWLGVQGEVEVEGEKVSLSELLETVRAGRRYVRLGPGRFARLEASLRNKLKQTDEVLFEQKSEEGLAMGKALAGKLIDIFSEEDVLDGDREWLELRARMEQSKAVDCDLPEGFLGSLRSYQLDGFQWMARLAHWEAGACLADDMGLGKTVQALALMLHRAELGPAMVIAPTSVGHGWVQEALKFTPGLRPRLYRGPRRREILDDLTDGDVLITSYDLLALDIDLLGDRPFATLVLDEAQAVKNPRTQRAKAANRVHAAFRIALTGTPLENHIGELWSIFHAVSPGLLGPWNQFQHRFAAPIERDGDLERRDLLVQRIRPFLLRRTKSEVAPELPPRTEVIEPVEISEGERELYDKIRREILESLASRSTEQEQRKRVVVLAGITRLRRLACHPRLLDSDLMLPSSKLTSVLNLIDGLLQRNERALIFSQFTSHLALLREALDFRKIPYLYLDGRTAATRRAKLVDKWADGTDPLFLISLKAGGTGLNLMGADLVIHLDPWWNPAVEDQAADRTHRIGQTRPVTVVRLIAQGTIEEAVLDLHERKRELARGLLEGAAAAATLSSDELLDLIRWGEDTGDSSSVRTLEALRSEQPPPPPKLPELLDPSAQERDELPLSPKLTLASSPAIPKREAPSQEEKVVTIYTSEVLQEIAERFFNDLEVQRESGAIRTEATVALYRRILKRFLLYTQEQAQQLGDSGRTLQQWRVDYLDALAMGTFSAPVSEPAIARTVLKRLKKFIASEQ